VRVFVLLLRLAAILVVGAGTGALAGVYFATFCARIAGWELTPDIAFGFAVVGGAAVPAAVVAALALAAID
jgi:hypothetical protein